MNHKLAIAEAIQLSTQAFNKNMNHKLAIAEAIQLSTQAFNKNMNHKLAIAEAIQLSTQAFIIIDAAKENIADLTDVLNEMINDFQIIQVQIEGKILELEAIIESQKQSKA